MVLALFLPCHTHEQRKRQQLMVRRTATEAYDKNLRLQMGRCPVRSVFPEALEVFAEVQDKMA